MGAIRALLLSCLFVYAGQAAFAAEKPVTLVFTAPDTTSQLALQEMQRETTAIMRSVGIEVGRTPLRVAQLGGELVEPVQVRLQGRCNMTGIERSARPATKALGWTHVSDGKVLRFIDLDCNRLRVSLFSVMWGEDFQHRDFLLGRALGRVLAHELHHALGRATAHTESGLACAQIRAENLIRGTARLYENAHGRQATAAGGS
jgi:hypothetical protein